MALHRTCSWLFYTWESRTGIAPQIHHQWRVKVKNHISWHVSNALPNKAQEAGSVLLLFSLTCFIHFLKLSSVFQPDTLPFCFFTSSHPPFSSVVFLLQHSSCFCIAVKCNMEHPTQGKMHKVYFSVDSGSDADF